MGEEAGRRGERGAVLIVGLLVLLVLTILSLAAMMSAGTESMTAGNDRSAKEAFYLAEAGVEEARSRLLSPSSPSPIQDSQPGNANWTAFLGTEQKSREKGYQNVNSNHVRYASLNPELNYVVKIIHKLDGDNRILRWGDSNQDGIPEENTTTGQIIYVLAAEGYSASGARKMVRVEAAKTPPIIAPAALYTKVETYIQGSSTYVIGLDRCGGADLPGIITRSTVRLNGNPVIEGVPALIENSALEINVLAIIRQYKKYANYTYAVTSATMTGMRWGTPTPGANQQSPTTCSETNIVHFQTDSTYIKLTGESSGCGLLLVEGDLSVQGGFQWNGVILATGTITFTGGGGKNVTGAILADGTISADLVGGDGNIIYCSRAVRDHTERLPLSALRWAELFQ